ncbi:hypothetical protein [Actinacidiphila acidipaludis]|uniref:Secreted protein n=1 Tax=Actinacidiphila acidipaludis TaxID=2873382 RepID=A0ABS7QG36_9ACTN|nr:hypothetical protein [Streptomyces acidipaludis]MBY8882129.1 hypothetical protein [Streptomyces acidipaludis]
MRPPLLFLDVDGPLNPYAAPAQRRPDGYVTIRVPWASIMGPQTATVMGRTTPLRVWLNPEHGTALLALEYDLCWATTWMGAANEWIAPVLGLPELPFVDFGTALLSQRPDEVHWKTEALVAYAAGRPFAWVDDEQSEADHAYVAAQHPAPALLRHVDPRVGMREDDFGVLAEFERSLNDPGANA